MDEVFRVLPRFHLRLPTKEKEIEAIKLKKQNAVKNQNFELAAGFRDQQSQLELELEELNRKWTDGENDTREIVQMTR